MPLRVRVEGEGSAERVLEFQDDTPELRFGRDPGRCQIAFPPGATQVSREHFAVKRVLGRYRLVLNRESPVFVDGEIAHDDQILEPLAAVQVGRGGPTVWLESGDESAYATTRGEKLLQPGSHTMLSRLGLRIRRHRFAVVFAAAILFAGGTFGAFRIRELQAGLRVNTLALVDLDQHGRTETLRAIRDFAEKNPDVSRFREVAGKIEPSIVLVVVKTGSGEESPQATAWVVGTDLVATNAHVAELHPLLEGRGTLFVRTCGEHPSDFEVVDVTVHPGYDDFKRLRNLYRPRDSAGGNFLDFIDACDVALMRVRSNGGQALPPPLALASQDEVFALRSGEPVTAIGFPMEDLAGNGVDPRHPKPVTQVGNITSVTSFFQGSAASADSELVRHNLPGVGGASGSPILNLQGRVVALHCAGNFTFMPRLDLDEGKPVRSTDGEMETVRIPMPGYNFGQRADLLRELLDGTAENSQRERTKRWEQSFTALRELGHEWLRKNPQVLVRREFAPFLDKAAKARGWKLTEELHEIARGEGSVRASGTEGAVVSGIDADRLEPGLYLVLALADHPEEVTLRVLHASGEVSDGRGLAGYSMVAFTMTTAEKLVFQVSRTADRPEGTHYVLSVYRAGLEAADGSAQGAPASAGSR